MPFVEGRIVGRLAVPEGFEPFGWCSRPAGSMKDRDTGFTVMHLHDPDEEMREEHLSVSQRVPRPSVGLCGAVFAGRWRQYVRPGDAPAYCTKHCDRCLRAVAERLHVPTFETRRTGVGNYYGRGNSGSGGRLTRVACSCGWVNRSNVTKREQVDNFREHVLDVIERGLWAVARDGYAELVVTSWPGRFLQCPDAQFEGLIAGEKIGGVGVGGRNVEIERVALPLRRMAD